MAKLSPPAVIFAVSVINAFNTPAREAMMTQKMQDASHPAPPAVFRYFSFV